MPRAVFPSTRDVGAPSDESFSQNLPPPPR